MTSMIGQTKRLTGTFTDENGAAVDPSTVTLRIYRQDSVTGWTKVAEDTPTRTSTGVYTALYTPTQAGTYRAEMTSYTALATPPTSSIYVVWQVTDSVGTI